MPELPEVDAIARVAGLHAISRMITSVEVLRQPANGAYFPIATPLGARIRNVFRLGKHVVFDLGSPFGDGRTFYIDCHNAMTGFWDWEHDPWTFDYVEGARTSSESDVRVKLYLDDGAVLRFHDARMFGRLTITTELPETGPELMETPMMMRGARVITLREFAEGVYSTERPIKDLLLDQSFLSGIGNIYSNEALLVSGIDPRTPSNEVYGRLVPILLESLRTCCSLSIPKVRYDWLNCYRRKFCGLCGWLIRRETVKGRATFICERCQS